MTWLRTDDGFPEHPKSDALAEHFGDDWAMCAVAFMAWHHLGCDCASRRTDGVFNAARARRVVRAPAEVVDRAVAALVKVGFLDKHRDGYVFHDWAQYQPTRAELDADRAARTERQKRWRENHPKNRDAVDGRVDASTPPSVDATETRDGDDGSRVGDARVDGGVVGAPSRPVPARPGPSSLGEETSSLQSPPGETPSGATSDTAKPTKGRRPKPAPTPDTIPLPGTLARRVFDAIVSDRALAPIVVNPGDAAMRWTDSDAFPGVDVIAEVKRCADYVATVPGKYSDGRAFLRRALQRKADEVARMPKPAASSAQPAPPRPARADVPPPPSPPPQPPKRHPAPSVDLVAILRQPQPPKEPTP